MQRLLRCSLFLVLYLLVTLPLLSCDSSGSNQPDFDQVKIESITLNNFPFTTDSGESWDFGSAPDPGIQVVNDTDGSLETTTSFFTNVSSENLPLEYANSPFTIGDLSALYSFELYDDDTNAPDFIGGVVFDPERLTDNYPESTTINADGISYTLELNWSE